MPAIKGQMDDDNMAIEFFRSDARRFQHIRKHVLLDSYPSVLPEDMDQVLNLRQEVRRAISDHLAEEIKVPEHRQACMASRETRELIGPRDCVTETGEECRYLRNFCLNKLGELSDYYLRCVTELSKTRMQPEIFRCHRHFDEKGFPQVEFAGRKGLKIIASSLDEGTLNLNTAFFAGNEENLERRDRIRNGHEKMEFKLHLELSRNEQVHHSCGA